MNLCASGGLWNKMRKEARHEKIPQWEQTSFMILMKNSFYRHLLAGTSGSLIHKLNMEFEKGI